MRNQLIEHVHSLFAHTRLSEDVQQEILQNSLDRYDDLIARGKSPDAAYALTIEGIGDLSEIGKSKSNTKTPASKKKQSPSGNRLLLRAIAIALYISCVIPVILLGEFGQEVVGVCLMFVTIAIATFMIIYSARCKPSGSEHKRQASANRRLLVRAIAIALYISCVIPVILFSEFGTAIVGVCVMFVMIAVATLMLILTPRRQPEDEKPVSEEKTKSAKLKIFLCVFLVLMLAAILFYFAIGSFQFGFGTQGTQVEGEMRLNASAIQNIAVDWTSGTITVCPGETDQITFHEILPDGKCEKMAYAIDGSTLKLYENNYKYTFNIGRSIHKSLVITVPKDWQGQTLSFDGSSMELQLQDLHAKSVTVDGSSCQVSFSGTIDMLEVDGSSCNVNINGTVNSLLIDGSSCELKFQGCLGKLEMDGSSCQAYVSATNAVTSIEIDGSSAELELILPAGCGYTAELDGSNAELNTDLPYIQKNGLYIHGDGFTVIEMDGSSCTLTIKERSA